MNLRKTLADEHIELATLADRLSAIVAADAPDPDFSPVRWRLNTVLSLHLAKEDRLLYPSLRSSADSTTRALAERFQAEMGDLADLHRDYCARWPIASVDADWPGFCYDTRALLALLRRRIVREDSQLYPRIDDRGGDRRARTG
jgi:hemerythrin-like domain-containing protein